MVSGHFLSQSFERAYLSRVLGRHPGMAAWTSPSASFADSLARFTSFCAYRPLVSNVTLEYVSRLMEASM
jgi:hypothetical protein